MLTGLSMLIPERFMLTIGDSSDIGDHFRLADGLLMAEVKRRKSRLYWTSTRIDN